jgi:DNA-binding response OmpR family regulator
MNLLLVDDEDSLRHLLAQYLTSQGYAVEEAAGAAQARASISKSEIFEFALIDWSLPDGSGLDVARELLEKDLKLRVIFTSGYPLDARLIPVNLRDRVRMLQKPYLPRALVEILNNWPL